jgi:phasin family protein
MSNVDTTNKSSKSANHAQPEIVKSAHQASAKPAEQKSENKFTATKDETKVEAKIENKVESKPANKSESKPASKAESKPVTNKKSSNVVELGKNARDAQEIASGKAQQMQARIMESSIENAEQLARKADVATRFFSETINIGRDQMEACAEASNIAAECANKMCEELVEFTNKSITENVEISKHFFSCRNAADIMELNTRFAQSNIERFLNESSKLTDMWFSMTVKASETISERMTDAADRLNKAMKK